MKKTQFIIIDDDPVNNFICLKTIQRLIESPSILAFTEATHALDFLNSPAYVNDIESSIIMFLDINMPLMSGWDFLNAFHFMNTIAKKQLKIYMLSSSVNPEDIARASSNEYVIDYIMKPLQTERLNSILRAAISQS